MNTLKTTQKKQQNKYPRTRPWFYTVRLSHRSDARLLKDLLDIIDWKAKPSINSTLDSREVRRLAEEYDMDSPPEV